VTCLQEPPEKINKPPILHASPHTSDKQPVMDRVERLLDRLPTTALIISTTIPIR
jgi:hypothetical protein